MGRTNLIILFFIFATLQVKSSAQGGHLYKSGECTHHCSHMLRTKNQPIGIYDQDQRVHQYDVSFYGIELEADPSSTFINGTTRVKLTIIEPTDVIVLELTNQLTVSQITGPSGVCDFTHLNETLVISLPDQAAHGETMEFTIEYAGDPGDTGFFVGIQSVETSFGDPVLWTLSEPHNARQWFPVKQTLTDKADSVEVVMIVPETYVGASNGLLISDAEVSGGRKRYHWKSNYPIAYYLISIAISNYQQYDFYAPLAGGTDSVLVQNFIYNRPEVLELNKPIIDQTGPMIQLMSEKWGNYPFKTEKYGHAMAPMGGAMEHQTISTMGYFGFDIIAHELAHHWFGNNVTCATWNDIWINEGFASYAEYLSREFLLDREQADQWMHNAHENIKSQPAGSVYVPTMELGNVFRIFNGRLSYRKGAAILHQLRFEINDDDLFFLIMEDFQNEFADSTATGDDFRRTTERITQKEWEWFFNQWYYGEGFPTYDLIWKHSNDTLYLRSSQKTSATYPDFFAGHLEFDVILEQGNSEHIRFFQDKPLQDFLIYMPGELTDIVFDPRKCMLKNFTLHDSTQIDQIDEPEQTIVFPNPFTEYLKLMIPIPYLNSNYSLLDAYGKLVVEGVIADLQTTWYLPEVTQGIYFLKLYHPSGKTETIKILRQ